MINLYIIRPTILKSVDRRNDKAKKKIFDEFYSNDNFFFFLFSIRGIIIE